MIKFTAIRPDERVMLFLGLTRDNLERLPQNKPTSVDLVELGLDQGGVHEIVIFYGESEEEITADLLLRGLIRRDTTVTIQEGP